MTSPRRENNTPVRRREKITVTIAVIRPIVHVPGFYQDHRKKASGRPGVLACPGTRAAALAKTIKISAGPATSEDLDPRNTRKRCQHSPENIRVIFWRLFRVFGGHHS